MEKLVLASGIIITCLATVAFNPGKEKNKISAAKRNAVPEQITAQNSIINTRAESNNSKLTEGYSVYTDTIPKKKSGADDYNINFKGDMDGKRVELREENSKIKELYIDGKKIPEDQYAQYQPMIEKFHTQMKEQTMRLKLQADTLEMQNRKLEDRAQQMEIDSKKMQEFANADMATQKELMKQQEVQMQKQAEMMNNNDSLSKIQSQKMQQDFMRKQEEFQKKQIELNKKVEQLELQQKKLELLRKDSLNVTSYVYTKPVVAVTSEVTVRPSVSITSKVSPGSVAIASTTTNVYPKASVSSVISTNSRVNVEPIKITTATATMPAISKIAVIPNSTSEDIINDLEEANVINSKDHLSVQLNNDELIVNGVKQPEEIHQQILKKHTRKPGDKISLKYSNK